MPTVTQSKLPLSPATLLPIFWPLMYLVSCRANSAPVNGLRVVVITSLLCALAAVCLRRLWNSKGAEALAIGMGGMMLFVYEDASAIFWWLLLLAVFFFAHHLDGRLRILRLLSAASIGVTIFLLLLMFYQPRKANAAAPIYPFKSQGDIYLIVLDSYAREDLLASVGIDNSQFIQSLREAGYTVDDCASSDYIFTAGSIASILNMQENSTEDLETLTRSAQNNSVMASMQAAGYQVVSFATGFQWTEFQHTADIYIRPERNFNLTEMETRLIDISPLRMLEPWIKYRSIYADIYRERTLTVLENLESAAAVPGPQFVFAHLLPPHPPFTFNADGSATDAASFLTVENNGVTRIYQEDYYAGYAAQLQYINSALLPILRRLAERGDTVIVTGDHGPWYEDTPWEILFAAHGVDYPPCMRTVNIFRKLFDLEFIGE